MRIPKLDIRCRPDPTYRRLLGDEAWNRLSTEIRLRFGLKPNDFKSSGRERIRYRGVMEEVRCSRAGWLLAQACRLIGTPLAFNRGRDVPVEVWVYKEAGGEGVAWERLYRFPGRRPVTVVSAKRPDRRDGLVECVGGGFGMVLRVFEADGSLNFLSLRYFWQLAHWRLPIPALLTPGTTHVVHGDEADGRFRFTMTVRHPWLGETYYQTGLFRAVEGI
ncbi:MAG: DUF4166 domain-containing protein [Rhodospirillales bacterium]|nr:DUF4166 domain-containing protein [Rhodospirillales bacterium]